MKFLIKLSTSPKEKPLSIETSSDDPFISELVSLALNSMSPAVSKFVSRSFTPFLGIAERGLKLDPKQRVSEYGLKDGVVLSLFCSGEGIGEKGEEG